MCTEKTHVLKEATLVSQIYKIKNTNSIKNRKTAKEVRPAGSELTVCFFVLFIFERVQAGVEQREGSEDLKQALCA